MFGLQDKAMAIIGGALSTVLGLALGFLWITTHFEIKSLKAERDRIQLLYDRGQRDLTQCRANRITLEDATQRQNFAVEIERLKGDARLLKLAAATTQASADAASAASRAATILSRKGTGDICADADAVILEAVR